MDMLPSFSQKSLRMVRFTVQRFYMGTATLALQTHYR
jgi:hypothetical protein